jgi:hypothetical protein
MKMSAQELRDQILTSLTHHQNRSKTKPQAKQLLEIQMNLLRKRRQMESEAHGDLHLASIMSLQQQRIDDEQRIDNQIAMDRSFAESLAAIDIPSVSIHSYSSSVPYSSLPSNAPLPSVNIGSLTVNHNYAPTEFPPIPPVPLPPQPSKRPRIKAKLPDKAETTIEPTKLPTKVSEDTKLQECVVCMATMANSIILPCMHVCLCQSCAERMRQQKMKQCPKCRGVIKSVSKVFF